MALAFCFYVRQYDPPTGLKSIFGNKEAIEDSLEIVGWNDTSTSNFDTKALVKNPYRSIEELQKHDFQEVINKQVQNFISDNFDKLVSGYYDQMTQSSTIDVLTLIGNKFGK